MHPTSTLLSLALLGGSVGARPSAGLGSNHHHHLHQKRSSSSSSHAAAPRGAGAKTLPIASSQPTGAATVPADFLGLNIESSFMNNYNNAFSNNLVSALAKRMSVPPVVRIGGTSGDEFVFDEGQTDHVKICVEGECPTGSAASYKIGPGFFEAYKAYPDAKMTIQAPLGPNVNETLVREFVRRAWEARVGAVGSEWKSKIDAIALGNEPEFYTSDVTKYVRDTLELERIVLDELKLEGDDQKIFEAGNNAKQPVSQYDVADILKQGMNKNGLTKATAEHLYQIDTTQEWTDATMQRLMLSHKAITERLDTQYMPSLRASVAEGVPYMISETAAVLASPINTFVSGFGFALWLVDFSLANAARGVARVNHMGGRPVANHVLWTPDHTAGLRNPGPQARAPFAAACFVADFLRPTSGGAGAGIGGDNDSGDDYGLESGDDSGSGSGGLAGSDGSDGGVNPFTVFNEKREQDAHVVDAEEDVTIQELDLDTEANPHLSAYAVYSSGRLGRVALVNMRLYNGTAAAAGNGGYVERGSEVFQIPVGDGVEEVQVQRLHADLGAAAMGYDYGGEQHNVTWAGEQWSKKVDEGKGHFTQGGSQVVEIVKVSGGVASVEVPDSEAVMVVM
ncbi:glycoside hydrolase family 79 protein [Apiospora rasikravindrae]|uniref:Glycoside hydrolase family 79 protein n=1 Tax=Apiospora rasikravindrae TaxID=990691 RepID=A0ABR1RQF9_9PEZI